MSCMTLAAIGLHLFSWHSEPGFNTVNPGIYGRAECAVTESFALGGQAGIVKNSEEGDSFYLAGTAVYTIRRVELSALAGGINGYKNCSVCPLGGVGVGFKFTDNITGRTTFLPGDLPWENTERPHAVTFSLEVVKRFNVKNK